MVGDRRITGDGVMARAVGSASPVRLVMAAPIVAIEPTATMRQAARLLADEDIGAVAVLGPVGLVGVLSERDIVRALATGAHPDATSVDAVMGEHPWSVGADASIEEVANLMLRAGIRHVPVRADGDVLGMVSIRDVLEVVRNDQRRGTRA
jgi:CBS domain-containing protein